jgi:hypothetical protein
MNMLSKCPMEDCQSAKSGESHIEQLRAHSRVSHCVEFSFKSPYLCKINHSELEMDISAHLTSVYHAYPDRGFKAYSVVFGAWLVLFPASGLLNSTGIFQAWLFGHQLQGYSESEIAWISSTFAFLFFFGGLGVGTFCCCICGEICLICVQVQCSISMA